jgi:hypothetical protein
MVRPNDPLRQTGAAHGASVYNVRLGATATELEFSIRRPRFLDDSMRGDLVRRYGEESAISHGVVIPEDKKYADREAQSDR